MSVLEKLAKEILSWPEVTVHPHRFGGREFRFRAAEIGHVHAGGILDIPFPRTIHDALIDEGLAEEHHWVPNSGWITFRIRTDHDLDRALWLARLSHGRYLLKTSKDPDQTFAQLSDELRLTSRFKSLLEPFLPRSTQAITSRVAVL
jgi:hypothetical protein